MVIAATAVLLIVLLALGMEIGIAIGFAALFAIFLEGIPIAVVSQNLFKSIDNYALLAVPFFVLAGNLMKNGNLAQMLFDFFGSFLKRFRGGLGIATMMSSIFFAAVSGSSVASSAALGRSMLDIMTKENYPKRLVAGMLAVGGTLGLMIPPSLTFILIGTMVGIPIGDLFIAGIVPGILEGLLLILVVIYLSNKYKYGEMIPKIDMRQVGTGFVKSFPVILMPVIILGGIYMGFFTPTEVSVVAVLYALFVSLLLYRTLKARDLKPIFLESAYSAAMIYLVVIGGNLLGFVMTRLGIADMITQIIMDMNVPTWAVLLGINIILLILGCFLDGVSMIIILAPLLFPVVTALGVHPIHFAVIMTANIEIATITPPVGLNLFVMSGISKLPVHEVVKGVVPFYVVRIVGLLFITYVPWLSLVLVQ